MSSHLSSEPAKRHHGYLRSSRARRPFHSGCAWESSSAGQPLPGVLQNWDAAQPLNVSSLSPLQYFNLPLLLLLLHILFLPSSPALCTKWKNSFIFLEFDLSFPRSGGLWNESLEEWKRSRLWNQGCVLTPFWLSISTNKFRNAALAVEEKLLASLTFWMFTEMQWQMKYTCCLSWFILIFTEESSDTVKAAAYILIGVGSLSMALGFFGCIGAIYEIRCLLGLVRTLIHSKKTNQWIFLPQRKVPILRP